MVIRIAHSPSRAHSAALFGSARSRRLEPQPAPDVDRQVAAREAQTVDRRRVGRLEPPLPSIHLADDEIQLVPSSRLMLINCSAARASGRWVAEQQVGWADRKLAD